MAVLMREDDGFDAAGTALQRGFQTLRDEVEHTVAFGQPAPVEHLTARRVEGLLGVVKMLLIRRLVSAVGNLATLVEVAAQFVHQHGSECCREVLTSGCRMQLAEADRRGRRDDPKCPRRQAPQQLEVPLKERAEAANLGIGCVVEEDRATVQVDADWKLLERHVPGGCRRADADMRQAIGFSRQRRQVHGLLGVGREPDELRVGEHGVEAHQTMDDAGWREWSAVPAVGLADGAIERLVVDLVDTSAVVSTPVRGRVSEPDELREKLACRLTVDDARERGVLALQTDAGVPHDGHQEARLALREAEVGDSLDAGVERHQMNSSARSGSADRPPVRALDPP